MLAQTEERFHGLLTIERTRYGDDVIVLSFAGELDLAELTFVHEVLEPVLAEPRAMVVVDLSELEFIGVKGVGMLFELAESRPGQDLLRLLPSRHASVNKVLGLTGVTAAIPAVSG
ncbi:MAG TPA: STAS domain-containing protein [Solirubrobacterales bacterium]|jgi:anti-anti-sigma factor|nr:STAS domain-containing protein [Solirubrobacterales bacterium]